MTLPAPNGGPTFVAQRAGWLQLDPVVLSRVGFVAGPVRLRTFVPVSSKLTGPVYDPPVVAFPPVVTGRNCVSWSVKGVGVGEGTRNWVFSPSLAPEDED